MKNKLSKILALLLAAVITCSLAVPAFSVENTDTLHIYSAEDLMNLVRNCTLDTWSQGKTVSLEKDISLEGHDFQPIPSFGGTFLGNGHTISGLELADSIYPAGLFGVVQEGGVIKGLTVRGDVEPSGDGDTLGGIAGINYGKIMNCSFTGFVCGKNTVGGVVGLNEGTGQMINCSFKGMVTGEHYVGGIAGQNAGSLIQCINNGSINTTEVHEETDLQSLNLNLRQLNSTEKMPAGTDIGGIAGFSTGLLQSCRNNGNVGYEHMGYNIGGIVGRQSGYLDGCINTGTVRGRKDVGGIAGQLEPQVTLKYSENSLSSLWDELDVLEDLMDRALSDAEKSSSAISSQMSGLSASVGTAKDTAVDLTDAMTDWANGNIDQINDVSARLSWVLDQMGPIMDDLGDALEQVEIASGQFSDALDDAELAAKWGNEAVAALQDALTDLQNAASHARDAYTHIKSAMTHLENSLGDTDRTKAALKELTDATADMAAAFSEIAGAASNIGTALDEGYQDAQEDPNWQKLCDGVDDLRSALVEISNALARVSDGLETLRQVFDTHPEGEPSNLELLTGALGALSRATENLDTAYEKFSEALDAYENGNIYGEDGALDQLGDGMEALNEANGEVQTAINNISTIVDRMENDERTGQALVKLAGGLADLNAGLGHANDAIVKIDGALQAIEADQRYQDIADRIYGYLGDINDALATLSAASDRISNAIKALEANINLDEADEAWKEIKNAADDAELAADDLDKAVSNLKLALTYLEKAGEYGSDAMNDLNKASETMGKAASLLRQATGKTAEVINELAEKPAIQFTPIGSDLTERGDALDDALSQMLDRVNSLNDTMSSSSDILLADLRAINRQVGVIIDLMRQISEESKAKEDAGRFEDVSDQELSDDRTSGRISNAQNSGSVNGDINVAGVVGSMAIEYDFDPEDDLSESGDRSYDFRYQLATVVRSCVNTGSITAKKDYAGGIVGRMDLGAAYLCQAYGSVESTNGDYVGGIAGYSESAILQCFAKCTLSGGRYVGGILGSGDEDSAVENCYTLMQITNYEQYCGAVSGTENGEFTGNYFVSDELAGLGRVSYSGKAEPISYQELSEVQELPDPFKSFTLTFRTEDTVLKTISMDYGASFDKSVYPSLPQKEGYYARWDRDTLQDLYFDTIVTVVYTPVISAIASTELRSNGRPIFFAEGNYDDAAVLLIQAMETAPAVHEFPQRFRDTLLGCFTGSTLSRKTIEQWQIMIPQDGDEVHTIRYLAPDGDPDGMQIYVWHEDGWETIETDRMGSYLCFAAAGEAAEIAVISTTPAWWVRVIAAVLTLLFLVVILRLVYLLIRGIKKRHKTRSRKEG